MVTGEIKKYVEEWVKKWVAGWTSARYYARTIFQNARDTTSPKRGVPIVTNSSGYVDVTFVNGTDHTELIADTVGAMVTGNTESGIAVAYQDADGTLDFTVAADTTNIVNDAVTNAKLANMAQDTIKGRTSGAGTGDPVDLTATQARTILNVENGADVTDATNVAAAGAVMTTGAQSVGGVKTFTDNPVTSKSTEAKNTFKSTGTGGEEWSWGTAASGSAPAAASAGDAYLQSVSGGVAAVVTTGGLWTINGISFGNETLSVYDEGTWTPSIRFGGGTTGMTYSLQQGKYTKIGNKVTAVCDITLSAKGSSTGTATLAGLPFTMASSINQVAYCRWITTATSYVSMLVVGSGGSTIVTFLALTAAATSWSSLNHTNFTNTTSIQFVIEYVV